MVPAAAVEAEPSKLTVSGAGPAAVEEDSTAFGGVAVAVAVLAVTVVVVMLVWPVVPVTVSLAV